MRAELSFQAVQAGEALEIGDGIAVRTAAAHHPNGCLAYRMDGPGRSVVFATDTEHDAVSGQLNEQLVQLAEGADVFIYDASYATYAERPVLCAIDLRMANFRRCAKQFYSSSGPKLTA